MGLPLLDGVFVSIVLSGGLNSILDALLVGGFVLGGGATIGVILSEFDDEKSLTIKRILIVGIFASIIAMIQASTAPIIEPFLNTVRFNIGAMIALLALSYKILPIGRNYKILEPGVIILITLVFSIQLNTPVSEIYIDYIASLYALLASIVAITISILTVVYRNNLINLIDVHILQYITSLGLFTENQGESLAVHGGDESDSADTTHVWYAERMF